MGVQGRHVPLRDAVSRGATDHIAEVLCYSLPELLGEKLRALAERCRPRDLYDVVHTHRHPDLIGRAGDVAEILAVQGSRLDYDHVDHWVRELSLEDQWLRARERPSS